MLELSERTSESFCKNVVQIARKLLKYYTRLLLMEKYIRHECWRENLNSFKMDFVSCNLEAV
jgi:hypothetical protein